MATTRTCPPFSIVTHFEMSFRQACAQFRRIDVRCSREVTWT